MAQRQQAPVIQVRPQPNVYTVLLWAAILAMIVAILVVGSNLLSATGYGMEIGDLFGGRPELRVP